MTPEELQEQLLKMQEEMQTLKAEKEQIEQEKKQAIQRQKELEEHNQKLFLKVTSNINTEEEKEKEEVPKFLDEKTFKLLDKHDKQFLNDILENEEEE